MKNIDRILMTLIGLGIIAGLFFVGFEIKQLIEQLEFSLSLPR